MRSVRSIISLSRRERLQPLAMATVTANAGGIAAVLDLTRVGPALRSHLGRTIAGYSHLSGRGVGSLHQVCRALKHRSFAR